MEVAALARVNLARRLLIGVVELIDVEAVLGDFPDRIDPAGQHIPVGVDVRRARESARHRDDGDRLVHRRDGRLGRLNRRPGVGPVVEAQHVAEQIVRDVGQPRVVHRQRGRKFTADRLLELTAQLDRHQRIHAQVEEPGLLADLGDVDARDLGDGVADEVQHQLPALLHRCRGEPLHQGGGTG